MNKRKLAAKLTLLASLLLVPNLSYCAGGMNTYETCEKSRGFGKRIFLIKQMGGSFSQYREVEGSPPPGEMGELVSKIEEAIFTNPKISSESLASEYAYATCMSWPQR